MFVKASTHKKLQHRVISLNTEVITLRTMYSSLMEDHNKLIRRINDKGGERFLEDGAINLIPQLNDGEIKTLIQLCHPDKHNGKESAQNITAKLLLMRG